MSKCLYEIVFLRSVVATVSVVSSNSSYYYFYISFESQNTALSLQQLVKCKIFTDPMSQEEEFNQICVLEFANILDLAFCKVKIWWYSRGGILSLFFCFFSRNKAVPLKTQQNVTYKLQYKKTFLSLKMCYFKTSQVVFVKGAVQTLCRTV